MYACIIHNWFSKDSLWEVDGLKMCTRRSCLGLLGYWMVLNAAGGRIRLANNPSKRMEGYAIPEYGTRDPVRNILCELYRNWRDEMQRARL